MLKLKVDKVKVSFFVILVPNKGEKWVYDSKNQVSESMTHDGMPSEFV